MVAWREDEGKMDVAYRREIGRAADGSRGRYAGMRTGSPIYRRANEHVDGVEFSRSRSFVTTGSLIAFALALALMAHFVFFNRTKQKLGF